MFTLFKQYAEKKSGDVGRQVRRRQTKRQAKKKGAGVRSPSTAVAGQAGQSGRKQQRAKGPLSVGKKHGYNERRETISTNGRNSESSHSDSSSGRRRTRSTSSARRHGAGGAARARKKRRRRERETRGP